MRRNREGKKVSKFLVYFIGLIMVFSAFGVIFWGGGTTNTIRDKGLKFTDTENNWETNIDGQKAVFAYLPSQVEAIPISPDIINGLKNVVEIDVTSDFNDTLAEEIALAQFQMSFTLNNFNVFVRNGYTTEQQNFPVIKCDDFTGLVPVIYFKSSNQTNVYLEDNCIIAEALNQGDILGIKDRLLYGILGVIE
jgi:hypothetical protein